MLQPGNLILAPDMGQMSLMDMVSFQAQLENSYHPAAAGTIDAVFRLSMKNEDLTFHVHHGTLTFVDSEFYDATFYFEDVDSASALLCGQADPFDAFMNGGFRADSNLMWAFALIAMFRTAERPSAG